MAPLRLPAPRWQAKSQSWPEVRSRRGHPGGARTAHLRESYRDRPWIPDGICSAAAPDRLLLGPDLSDDIMQPNGRRRAGARRVLSEVSAPAEALYLCRGSRARLWRLHLLGISQVCLYYSAANTGMLEVNAPMLQEISVSRAAKACIVAPKLEAVLNGAARSINPGLHEFPVAGRAPS
jgi:hypothetical protein